MERETTILDTIYKTLRYSSLGWRRSRKNRSWRYLQSQVLEEFWLEKHFEMDADVGTKLKVKVHESLYTQHNRTMMSWRRIWSPRPSSFRKRCVLCCREKCNVYSSVNALLKRATLKRGYRDNTAVPLNTFYTEYRAHRTHTQNTCELQCRMIKVWLPFLIVRWCGVHKFAPEFAYQ